MVRQDALHGFGLSVGGPEARVTAVRPDSPAQQASLEIGDQITDFQGEHVRNAIDYYVRLYEQQPGDKIKLAYTHDGRKKNAGVPLQPVPAPDGVELAQRLLGVSLGEFDDTVRRKYDLPRDVGVYVDEVEPDGPADQAQMLPGDIIMRLNRVGVADLDHVGLALESVKPGEKIYIHGLRVRGDYPFVWTIEIPTRRQ